MVVVVVEYGFAAALRSARRLMMVVEVVGCSMVAAGLGGCLNNGWELRETAPDSAVFPCAMAGWEIFGRI